MIRNAPMVIGRGMRARSAISRPGKMRGISLIEVLVSVVIIAIGLLGIAAMQSVALRGSQSSLESSQAVMQTNAILEAMRANRANAVNYIVDTCAVPSATATLAQSDLRAWITSLKSTIVGPAAAATDATVCGQIEGCPDNCVITVRWDDMRAGGNAARSTFVTRTRI